MYFQISCGIPYFTDDDRENEPEKTAAGTTDSQNQAKKSLPNEAFEVSPDYKSGKTPDGHQIRAPKVKTPTSPKLTEKGLSKGPSTKRPLAKSLSGNSPGGMRQTFQSRESSPFRDPKPSQSSYNITEEMKGRPFKEPKKCASSPELSSPVAAQKGSLEHVF